LEAISISFESLGKDTAKVALRVLRGEKSGRHPFEDASIRLKMVDARELARWGIH